MKKHSPRQRPNQKVSRKPKAESTQQAFESPPPPAISERRAEIRYLRREMKKYAQYVSPVWFVIRTRLEEAYAALPPNERAR